MNAAHTPRPITPTALDASALADFLTEQAATMRPFFQAHNPDLATGSRVVHDGAMELAKQLRAGDIAPVVAQVRIVAVNRRAMFYRVRTLTAHRPTS